MWEKKKQNDGDLLLLCLLYGLHGPVALKEYLLLVGVECRRKNILCFLGSVDEEERKISETVETRKLKQLSNNSSSGTETHY